MATYVDMSKDLLFPPGEGQRVRNLWENIIAPQRPGRSYIGPNIDWGTLAKALGGTLGLMQPELMTPMNIGNIYRGTGAGQKILPTFATESLEYAKQYGPNIQKIKLLGNEKIADLTGKVGKLNLADRLVELGLNQDEVNMILKFRGKDFNNRLGELLKKKGYDVIVTPDEYHFLYPERYKPEGTK